MSTAIKVRGIFGISVFAVSLIAFTMACDDNKKTEENNSPPDNLEGASGENGGVVQDGSSPGQQETAGESQTEDNNQPQVGESAAGAGGSQAMDSGVPAEADAAVAQGGGTVVGEGGIVPVSDAAPVGDSTTLNGSPCAFDMNTAVTLPDAGAGFTSNFQMPVINGVCLTTGDPCPGGSLAELNLPQIDAGITVEIDLSGGCPGGSFCCIAEDQCATANVSMQESIENYLNGPSQLNPGMTVRESLASLGITDISMNFSCMAEAECTGVFALNIGCPQGSACCMTTPFDDLMGNIAP
ncbi:MAG: hypothetical protein JXA30_06335 [Deltaproteobacteria bacterium]|nr:hypothetical protein [Deltaproteobacteria bacterium]